MIFFWKSRQTARDITPSELHESIETMLSESRGQLQVVDVRTIEEYSQDHLVNSIHIPVSEIATRLAELDREKATVCYCRSGMRSAKACEILVANGFIDVANLKGGIEAWKKLQFAVIRGESI